MPSVRLFHLLASVKGPSINMGRTHLLEPLLAVVSDTNPEVGLRDSTAVLFAIFLESECGFP